MALLFMIGLTFILVDDLREMLFKYLIKLYKKVNKRPSKSEIDKANMLYKCSNSSCKRLFREYQLNMYKARHLKLRCPHCEERNYSSTTLKDKWTDTHPDCPKVSRTEYKNILKTISLLIRLRKEDEEQQRFEEYNKVKADYSWVKNLEKSNE